MQAGLQGLSQQRERGSRDPRSRAGKTNFCLSSPFNPHILPPILPDISHHQFFEAACTPAIPRTKLISSACYEARGQRRGLRKAALLRAR